MSETVNDKQVYSLLEVTRSIQKTLAERYKNSFWVKAEMNKLNYYAQIWHGRWQVNYSHINLNNDS